MSSKPRMSTFVSPDRATARIKVDRGRGRTFDLDVDAQELEQIIATLMDARASISPAVPESVDGVKFGALSDYRWRIWPMKIGGSRLLCIRHRGVGWFALAMPDEDAAKMAEWLSKPLPDGDAPAGSA